MTLSSDPLVRAFEEGFQIFPRDIGVLASELSRTPADLALRARYSGGLSRAGQSSSTWRAKMLEQAFWWLEHQPGSSVTPHATRFWALRPEDPDTARVRAAWIAVERQHPNDARVVVGAGIFLASHDPEFAGQLMRRAVQLDLTLVDGAEHLSYLVFRHFQRMRGHSDHVEQAAAVLDTLGVSLRLERDPLARRFVLLPACRGAFECGHLDLARKFATELLHLASSADETRGDENGLHYGHLVLGGIALREGDLAGAKQHLLDAARIEGSLQLGSFGPNMQLANELLERGERDVVIEYLDLCAKFWESGLDRLNAWKGTIAGGGSPDFAGNLYY